MIVGVLTGTTASGKSAAALQLAEKRDLEIISADSRQIYRGFRIGTGQPTRLEQSRVVHHFVDHLAPELHFSAGEFARSVVELEKRSPEKKRLIVGGTGFYLSALLFGLPPIPPVSADMRRQIQEELLLHGSEQLYSELQKRDPKAAERISSADGRRITRALEVLRSTGTPWSEWKEKRVAPYPTLPVVVLIPRADLNRQFIIRRVEGMFEQGWVEEVKGLLAEGVSPTAPAFGSLGYPEVLAHLRGELSFLECKEKIITSTAQYAKRQRTYFRGQFPNATELQDVSAEFLEETFLLS